MMTDNEDMDEDCEQESQEKTNDKIIEELAKFLKKMGIEMKGRITDRTGGTYGGLKYDEISIVVDDIVRNIDHTMEINVKPEHPDDNNYIVQWNYIEWDDEEEEWVYTRCEDVDPYERE